MKKNRLLSVAAVCLAVILVVLLMMLPKDPTLELSAPTFPSTGWTGVQTETSASTENTGNTESVPPASTAPSVQPNRFTASDFADQDGYMACLSAPYQLGIDVSKYQGEIDWDKVANAGIAFVIIRIGGRGYGAAGNLYADDKAQAYYAGAKAAGLKVGAYFFSQSIQVSEAQEEAEYALELTKDWQLDMPIVYDWEYVSESARTANTDAETVTACAAAFCDKIEAAGKQAMIYIRPELNKLILSELTAYAQWVALYSDQMDYPYHFEMWQYTNTGRVPGVKGNVDIDLYMP